MECHFNPIPMPPTTLTPKPFDTTKTMAGFFGKRLIAAATGILTTLLAQVAAAQTASPPHPLEYHLNSGTAIRLGDGEAQFFAILTNSETGIPQGGVVLIPDTDNHPDWPRVIRPLRTGLPAYGWTTISIETQAIAGLDTLHPIQSTMDTRINLAIDHLRNLGINNIAVLGHGTGASIALKFAADASQHAPNAFIGVGVLLTHPPSEHPYSVDLLKGSTVPVLDIYGSRDLDPVLRTASARRLAAKTGETTARPEDTVEFFKQATIAQSPQAKRHGHIVYRQQRIEGADHDFSGMSATLVKRIAGWLSRHAEGAALVSKK